MNLRALSRAPSRFSPVQVPLELVEVDLAHPAAQGFFYVPGAASGLNPLGILAGPKLALESAATIGVSSRGPALVANSVGTTSGVNTPCSIGLQGRVSIFWYGDVASAESYTECFGFRYSGGPTFEFNYTGNVWNVQVVDSSGATATAASSASPIGAGVCAVASYDPADDLLLHLNGTLIASVAGTGKNIYNGTNALVVNYNQYNSVAVQQAAALFGVTGYLTQADAARLAATPFAMLPPKYVPRRRGPLAAASRRLPVVFVIT